LTPPHRSIQHAFIKVADVLILFACLATAYSLANDLSMPQILASLNTPRPAAVFLTSLLLGVAWHWSLNTAHLYRSRGLGSLQLEVNEIVIGASLATLYSLLWMFIIRAGAHRGLRHYFVAAGAFFCLSAVTVASERFVIGVVTRFLGLRGHNLRHLIIIGTNKRAIKLGQHLIASQTHVYHLHGYVDQEWWDKETHATSQYKLLGNLDTFPELLRNTPVDEIIIALPIASFYQEISRIVSICRHHGIVVRSTSSFCDAGILSNESLAEVPYGTIVIHDASWDVWSALAKRSLDFAASLSLLILLSPVLLLTALLIRLTSPGPVFFVQTRVGRGKRLFRIFKFRTMVTNAESMITTIAHLNESRGPTFKAQTDPRITGVGAFLRKTSLDELPQLLNVLLGDMSLVGPRPLPLRDVAGFSEDWHRRRFSVKPGITCLWQVMGRSSIGFGEWMALDMRYIDHWSIWLDLRILLWTIPAVLRGSGAV
jgi:exopolysaccharide biosynthesis polyprenyl glycosylphosphotransferase